MTEENLLREMITRVRQLIIENYQGLLVWEEMQELLGVPICIPMDGVLLKENSWGIADRRDPYIEIHPTVFAFFGEEALNIILAHEFTHCLTPGVAHGPEFISMFEEIWGGKYEEAELILKKTEKGRPSRRDWATRLLQAIFLSGEVSQPAEPSSDRRVTPEQRCSDVRRGN